MFVNDAVEIAPGQRPTAALLEIRFDGCYPIVAGQYVHVSVDCRDIQSGIGHR